VTKKIWMRVDGGLPLYTNTGIPLLFTFDQKLLCVVGATNPEVPPGLFAMSPHLDWYQSGGPVGGARIFHSFTVITGTSPLKTTEYLYATDADKLWFVEEGKTLDWRNWTSVSSSGLTITKGPKRPRFIVPLAVFKANLYAAVYKGNPYKNPGINETFNIYRSPDIGKPQMRWSPVVSNGFGDPQNNHRIGTLIPFKNRILAITSHTHTGSPGDYQYYGRGIEVWESPAGNPGTWNQINIDGFGTEATINDVTVRTNQQMGCALVYNNILYVETSAHYHGGQVWSYDGTGLNGWKEVTPDSMKGGNTISGDPPIRASDMVKFGKDLYLAEGFPTSNLDTYNGTAWSVAIPGPNPFDSTNDGICSLAVFKSKIYAATYGNEYGQVWGYPFESPMIP
jgi:hypothetical protein